MLDSTPNESVKWTKPKPQNSPISVAYPESAEYQLVISPTLDVSILAIECQIQPGR
jgi:hypothetical protein